MKAESVLVFFALPALLAGQTPTSFSCEAPAGLRAVIREQTKVEIKKDGRQERRARIQALVAKYPDDFWVLLRQTEEYAVLPADLLAGFEKRYQANPGDPAAACLYACALTGTRTPKAIEIFTALVQKTPSFATPWLKLATIYNSENFKDRAKLQTYVEGYLERCPDSEPAARQALRIEKSGQLATFTKALRRRIEGKPDPETVPLFSQLWTLEFRITPPPEHARLREHIAEDLKFLSGLDKKQFKTRNSLLKEGYKLTGNKTAQEKLAAEEKTSENAARAFFEAQEAWSKANPRPSSDSDPKQRDAYFQKLLQALDEWVPKLPGENFVLRERLRTLAEIRGTRNKTLIREGEKLLDIARKNTGSVRMSTPVSMQVASIWAKRGIQLDRIPALVQDALSEQAKRNSTQDEWQRSDLNDQSSMRLIEDEQRWHVNVSAWQTLVLAYTKSGKSAPARGVLAKWGTAIEERRKRADEIRKKQGTQEMSPHKGRTMEVSFVQRVPTDESNYYKALAEVAVVEKRKLDALAFYQTGLRALASRDPLKTEIGRQAASLWKTLGGTPEGWQQWLGLLQPVSGSGSAASSHWSSQNRSLPEFHAPDQTGKTWTRVNFQGKATFINIWATWCGPCRMELPHLQKLYDKVKDRSDVQVVTISIDENLGVVEPFLQENKYTFPVLLTKSLTESFVGAVPTNWIADASGTVRLEAVGFDNDNDAWVQQTLAQLEKVGNVARSSTAPSSAR